MTPLDDRIAMLTTLMTDPPPDIDVAELAAILGSSLLERHVREVDEAALNTGIAYLRQAVLAAPRHEHRLDWYESLGFGYGELAGVHGSVADYQSAIEWYTAVHVQQLDDDRRRLAAVRLVELHWELFWVIRYELPCDLATARAATDRLVDALDVIPAGPDGTWETRYARMLSGLGHLERHEIDERPADLDTGISVLADVLPLLPADTPWRDVAMAELANAYLVRAVLDHDRASLDLAVGTGERAIAGCAPDRPDWRLIHRYQARAYEVRHRETLDQADLDRAIACWRVVLATGAGDEEAEFTCGVLLRERAERTGPVDLDESIRLLELASRAPDATAYAWYELGCAYHARWKITRAGGGLDAADRCLETAVALGGFEDNDLLHVHAERLGVGYAALDRDSALSYWEAPPSAARYRLLLAGGRTALDLAVAADPELRGMLAALLAFGEMWVSGHDALPYDPDRVSALLALADRVAMAPEEWQPILDVSQGLLIAADVARSNGGDRAVSRFPSSLTSGHLDDLNDQLQRLLTMAGYSRTLGHGNGRGSHLGG